MTAATKQNLPSEGSCGMDSAGRIVGFEKLLENQLQEEEEKRAATRTAKQKKKYIVYNKKRKQKKKMAEFEAGGSDAAFAFLRESSNDLKVVMEKHVDQDNRAREARQKNMDSYQSSVTAAQAVAISFLQHKMVKVNASDRVVTPAITRTGTPMTAMTTGTPAGPRTFPPRTPGTVGGLIRSSSSPELTTVVEGPLAMPSISQNPLTLYLMMPNITGPCEYVKITTGLMDVQGVVVVGDCVILLQDHGKVVPISFQRSGRLYGNYPPEMISEAKRESMGLNAIEGATRLFTDGKSKLCVVDECNVIRMFDYRGGGDAFVQQGDPTTGGKPCLGVTFAPNDKVLFLEGNPEWCTTVPLQIRVVSPGSDDKIYLLPKGRSNATLSGVLAEPLVLATHRSNKPQKLFDGGGASKVDVKGVAYTTLANVNTFKSGEVEQLVSTDTIALVRTNTGGLHWRLASNNKFYRIDVGEPVIHVEAGGNVVLAQLSDSQVKVFVHGADTHTLTQEAVTAEEDAFHCAPVDFAEIQPEVQTSKVAAMKASKKMICFLLEEPSDENHNGVAAQLFSDEAAH